MLSNELLRRYFGDNPCSAKVKYSEVRSFIPDEAHDKEKYKDVAPVISEDEARHEQLWEWKATHCFVKKDITIENNTLVEVANMKRVHPKGEILREKGRTFFIYPSERPTNFEFISDVDRGMQKATQVRPEPVIIKDRY